MAGSRWLWLMMLVLIDCGGSARILGLFPLPARSHMISFTALMQELSRRGHQVTVISGFPVSPPIANHTDIPVHSSFPDGVFPNLFTVREKNSTFDLITAVWDMGLTLCERELKHPNVLKFIEDKESEFDLIIVEIFFTECFYGFLHKFKVPTIQISSNTITSWMGEGVGNVHTASYIPDIMLGLSSPMTFLQRMMNSLVAAFVYLGRHFYYLPKQRVLIQKYFKDPTIPPIEELERNTSLLLLNSHFSLMFPRPLTPNTIEVGGMHIKPGNTLPKDLQKFMDEAPHGVVYFSLGSNVRNKDMPLAMRQAFMNAFAKLKQKILWKWEADAIPGLPANVKVDKWLPQNDILAHPSLKVFMTHSGLLSTQEATYHGVPLLAIPVAGDQVVNAANVRDKGFAVMLELANITEQSVVWALEELISNPSYRENAKRSSSLLRDQQHTPLQKAVYWTEYVIRHKGAAHMRSGALDLWWYQYYLLDVMALLLGSVAVILLICTAFCRLIVTKLRKISIKSSKSKKTN